MQKKTLNFEDIFDENSKENLNVKAREWGSLSGLFSNFC